MAERNYLKYSFVKIAPEWRRRSAQERAQDKREFAAACAEFAGDHRDLHKEYRRQRQMCIRDRRLPTSMWPRMIRIRSSGASAYHSRFFHIG